MIGLITRHVVDNRRLEYTVHRGRNGYRIAGKPVQKVGGSVQRIDHPD